VDTANILSSVGIDFQVEDLPGQNPEINPLGRNASHFGVVTIPNFTLYTHQIKVVELLLAGQNVLLTSGTASGKTEAACLGVLAKSRLQKYEPCQVLFLYPTKALANDQAERIVKYFSPFSVCRFDGDNDKRRSEVSHSEIVLSNPQMLTEHLKFASPFSSFLANLSFLIIDEVHLYNSYQWSLLLSYFNVLKQKGLQTQVILLSATLGNASQLCQIAGDRLGRIFIHVDGGTVAAPAKRYTITHKVPNLMEFLKELAHTYAKDPIGTLMFLPYKTQVNSLHASIDDKRVVRHHGSIKAEERYETERNLKSGEASVCLTCKTLQQGIDIGRVGRVIHVGLPDTVAEFRQREGRKGRVPGSHAESILIPFAPWDAAIIGDTQRYRRYLAMPTEATPLPLQSAASTLFDAFYASIYHLPQQPETLKLAKELGWVESRVDLELYMMEDELPLCVEPTELGGALFHNLSFYGFGRVPLVYKDRRIDETSYSEAVRSALPGCFLNIEGEPYIVSRWSKYPVKPDPELVIFLQRIEDSEYARFAGKVAEGTVFSRVQFLPSDITVESLRGPFSIVKLRPNQVDILEIVNMKPKIIARQQLLIQPQLPLYTNAFMLTSEIATEADCELAVHIIIHAMREGFSIPVNTYAHVVISDGLRTDIILYEVLWGDTHLLLDVGVLLENALRLANSPCDELLLPRCAEVSFDNESDRVEVIKLLHRLASLIGR